MRVLTVRKGRASICTAVMHYTMHEEVAMKAVTVRSIPPEVARAIRQKAKKKGISINKAVISLLEERTGTQGKRQPAPIYHDLDSLAGSWSRVEATTFSKSLSEQRRIDPDLWK